MDGSNNPSLPQGDKASHSLLLERGLFRVALVHGLRGTRQTVSVFRRPRPVANMKYVLAPDSIFNIKTGELAAIF